MAQIEPMDVENDFEDKENLLQVTNILSRTSCTEKGYEEMDVSEISMKLRYSVTPCSSPMSKSFTGNCDSKFYDTTEAGINDSLVNGNISLTHSLNSTLTKVDNKGNKLCPLQQLAPDLLGDINRNPLSQRSLDSNHVDPNVSITFNDNLDESLSLPSTSSSSPQTPEAITPTKEIPKDGGSPIMRGLKSVFSMFRSSQSPIAPPEVSINQTNVSEPSYSEERLEPLPAAVSTPISNLKSKDSTTKRNSPLKESLVFNEDLEKELLWKDDSTIIFKDEKIPLHKLLLQPPHSDRVEMLQNKFIGLDNGTPVKFMDISQNELGFCDKITADIESNLAVNVTETLESDSEFLDCETTFTKNELNVTDSNEHGKNTNTNVNASPHISNKQIEDGNNLEFQKLNLISSNISSSINPVYVLDGVCKNVLVEKNSSIDNSQGTEIGMIVNNTEMVESIAIQKQNNPNVISDNNENNCVTGGIKSDNLNNNASSIRECDSSMASMQDILDVASNQVKMLCQINNGNALDQSLMYVDRLLEGIEKNYASEIGIEDQLTNTCEYNNKFTTYTHVDGQYSECLSQIISNELKTTDLIIDNNKSDKNIEKNIINFAIKEQLESENIPITLINNEQDLHKDVLANEIVLNEHSKSSATATHSLDRTIEFNLNSKKSDSSLSNKEHEVDITNNEKLKVDGEISLCNNQQKHILNSELDASVNNIGTISIGISPTFCSNNNNVSAPMDIPLPSDNELEQEVAIDIKKEQVSNVILETLPLNIESDGCNILGKTPLSDIILLEKDLPTNKDFRNEYITLEVNKEELATEKDIDSIESNTLKINLECSTDKNIDFNDYLYIKTELDASNVAINETKNLKCVLPNEQKLCPPEVTDEQLQLIDQNCMKNNLNVGNENVENICIQMSPLFKTNTDALIVSSENNSKALDSLNKQDHDILVQQITSYTSRDQDSCINEIVSNENILESGLTIEEDEITISTGSSPYVSVTEVGLIEYDKDILEEDINQINDFPASPSVSPKPIRKGYDINFDDIDDPFATKTKIRSSPTLETPTTKSLPLNYISKEKNDKKPVCFQNRRKSQPERRLKKSTRNSNPNFDCVLRNEQTKIEHNETKDIKNSDLKFEDFDNTIVPIINNTETLARDINNSMENFSNVILVLKDDCAPVSSENNFVMEQEHFSITTIDTENNCTPIEIQVNQIISGIENKGTLDTIDIENNCTPIEIQVNQIISGIENKGTLGDSSNKTILTEPKNSLVFETIEYSEFGKEIEKSLKSLNHQLIGAEAFDQKAEKLLQNPEEINQSIVNSKTDISEERKAIFKKSLELKLEETFEHNNQEEDQELKKFSCNDKIETIFQKTADECYLAQEILTEDEDTVEGPILEADDSSHVISHKKFESDKDNMMKYDSTSAPTIDENLDNDELFIDAEAFEFLLNQNKSNVIADSGKESLFLKFDPLFAKRVSSDGILAALTKFQKIQSTPKRISNPANEENIQIDTHLPGPSNIDSSYVVMDNLEVSSPKPMMVVNPAVNPVVTPRKVTPKLNRRSLTFTSPAIAVIDRLLSLSGNDSLIDQNIYQHGRENNETDVAIMQLRELLAEKEINVHNLRCESKELKDRLANIESEMKSLENETGERLRKINDLNERLAEKTKINKSMAVVVEEYERTIASLISDIQLEKKHNTAERNKLVKERDEQTAHLSSMEVSFSDLHSKYEKSKQIILSMKANEDIYKKSLREFDESLVKMQSNYEFLKQHATSKLNHANQELEKINKAHESEVLKLNALIKRKELHITSLEETLAQKTKANEELTAICDELINKVG